MTAGLEEEGKITGFFKFGEDRLMIIKEYASYEITMADSIDPDRQNINIPNIQQRILRIGSESKILRDIILTSDSLFNETYLKNIKCGQLRENALNALQELLSMQRVFERLKGEQDFLMGQIKEAKLKDGLIIPYLDDATQSLKNFLQRADHFIRELFLITREFEKGFGNIDGL